MSACAAVRAMSRQIPRDLPSGQRVVLMALATYADFETGENARPAVRTLMADTGRSRGQVIDHLGALEARGLITADHQPGKVTTYALRLDPSGNPDRLTRPGTRTGAETDPSGNPDRYPSGNPDHYPSGNPDPTSQLTSQLTASAPPHRLEAGDGADAEPRQVPADARAAIAAFRRHRGEVLELPPPPPPPADQVTETVKAPPPPPPPFEVVAELPPPRPDAGQLEPPDQGEQGQLPLLTPLRWQGQPPLTPDRMARQLRSWARKAGVDLEASG